MTDISQIELIAAISKWIQRTYHTPVTEPHRFNAIIHAADLIVAEFAREMIAATPGMGLAAWRTSDDTGASSLYMMRVLCFGQRHMDIATPRDPADFGRCVRFLDAVPEARKELKALGFLSRDARVVERKKYGLRKARRASQWKKR